MIKRSEFIWLFNLFHDARRIEHRHRELQAELTDALNAETGEQCERLEDLMARIDEEARQILDLEQRLETSV